MTSVSAALNTWETLKKETTTDRLGVYVQNDESNSCSTDGFQALPTIVLRVPSKEETYSAATMRDLCRLEKRIQTLKLTRKDIHGITTKNVSNQINMTSIFSLAKCNYARQTNGTGLKKISTCGFNHLEPLEEDDVFDESTHCFKRVHGLFEQLFRCMKPGAHIQLKNILLSQSYSYNDTYGDGDSDEAFYTAAYIPVSNSTAASLAIYKEIWNDFDFEVLEIVGLSMTPAGVNEILSKMLNNDLIRLVPPAAIGIILLMWIYTGSFLYTLFSAIELLFAFGSSYFIYFYVYQFNAFWFTNYLSGIILLGIGADDCFVLFHALDGAEKEIKQEEDNPPSERNQYSSHIQDIQLQLQESIGRKDSHLTRIVSRMEELELESHNKSRRVRSLSKAAAAMFVTTLTTCVAFTTNVTTDVVAIKAFGVFAATLVLVDYALAITFLPASWNLIRQYSPNCSSIAEWLRITAVCDCMKKAARKFFSNIPLLITKENFENSVGIFYARAKYFFAPLIIVLLIGASILTFVSPGIPIARNSSQLFQSDNPVQWYNTEFNTVFKLPDQAIAESIHVVWGVKPYEATGGISLIRQVEPKYIDGFRDIFDNNTEGREFLDRQLQFCRRALYETSSSNRRRRRQELPQDPTSFRVLHKL